MRIDNPSPLRGSVWSLIPHQGVNPLAIIERPSRAEAGESLVPKMVIDYSESPVLKVVIDYSKSLAPKGRWIIARGFSPWIGNPVGSWSPGRGDWRLFTHPKWKRTT